MTAPDGRAPGSMPLPGSMPPPADDPVDEPVRPVADDGKDQAVDDEVTRSRAHSIAKLVLVLGYLFVVFGLILPSVVDYEAMLEALAATTPQALAVVALIGLGCWLLEGLAIVALMPGLSARRGVTAYLSMAAVGNTIPGPVSLAVGYGLFRLWKIPRGIAVLGVSLNSLLAQVGKLALPAIAIFMLTLTGKLPTWGYFAAALISLPIIIGALIGIWVLHSEAFARRVGAMATRATDAVAHRLRRPEPGDLTDELLDFRDSAGALLRRRALPASVTQTLVRAGWGVCLYASLRAVGLDSDVLPVDVILAVYAAVVAITVIPIAPGGAGLPELLYIAFFTNYVNDPAYEATIAAGVMLFRLFQWFLIIPVGYIVLLFARRAARKAPPVSDPLYEALPTRETT